MGCIEDAPAAKPAPLLIPPIQSYRDLPEPKKQETPKDPVDDTPTPAPIPAPITTPTPTPTTNITSDFRKINDYTIISVLGKGAYGTVYYAKSVDKSDYALKEIRVEELQATAKQEIRKQAQIMCSLDHKNIVTARQFFFYEQQKLFVIVMDYCCGGDLAHAIGKINLKESYNKMLGIAQAVAYLHRKKIVHRDIKPENILLDVDGVPKLSDLGISRDVTPAAITTFKGTPQYMAPEILEQGSYTETVDIWALGVVFLEMLSGKRIGQLIGAGVASFVKKDFPSADHLKQVEDYRIRDLIKKMLVRNPQERIKSEGVVSVIKTIIERRAKFKYVKVAYETGDQYEGEDDEKEEGKGTETLQAIYHFSCGDKYEGEWVDGKQHGKGTYQYANGDKHVGQYKADNAHGPGIIYYQNGNRYQGQFKDDFMCGKGKYFYNDGAIYEGEFKDGLENGFGVMTYEGGDRYEGQWKDDNREGKGKCVWSNGDTYEGQWKDDKMHGKGKYTYAETGEVYQGEFKEDMLHGQGKLTKKDGTVQKGRWVKDVMQ